MGKETIPELQREVGGYTSQYAEEVCADGDFGSVAAVASRRNQF